MQKDKENLFDLTFRLKNVTNYVALTFYSAFQEAKHAYSTALILFWRLSSLSEIIAKIRDILISRDCLSFINMLILKKLLGFKLSFMK